MTTAGIATSAARLAVVRAGTPSRRHTEGKKICGSTFAPLNRMEGMKVKIKIEFAVPNTVVAEKYGRIIQDILLNIEARITMEEERVGSIINDSGKIIGTFSVEY